MEPYIIIFPQNMHIMSYTFVKNSNIINICLENNIIVRLPYTCQRVHIDRCKRIDDTHYKKIQTVRRLIHVNNAHLPYMNKYVTTKIQENPLTEEEGMLFKTIIPKLQELERSCQTIERRKMKKS